MKGWILRIGIIVIGCALAIELAGASFFLWKTHQLIYLDRAPDRPREFVAPTQGNSFKYRLHPYFGFSGPYDQNYGSVYTNSVGSQQLEPITIPFVPAPNDFVVVVSGGSVAERLVIAHAGGVPLREALQAIPALAGKKVVVLNIAQGGGKQPQQLLELSYLLVLGQRIDLVINIDGFNEFASGYQNDRVGLHPVFPAAQRMVPLALESCDAPPCRRYHDLANRLASSRAALTEHSDELHRARTGLSLVRAYLLASWDRRIYHGAVREYLAIFDQAKQADFTARLGLDLRHDTQGLRVFDLLFDLWLRSSQQMKLLSAANGAAYLHVIQPNQYFSKHVFSDREREIALLPTTFDYRLGVENGYALLRERHSIVEANGIVSAVDLFDDEPDEVYNDNCCHYTAKGETLLGRAIAAEVERRLKQDPSKLQGH